MHWLTSSEPKRDSPCFFHRSTCVPCSAVPEQKELPDLVPPKGWDLAILFVSISLSVCKNCWKSVIEHSELFFESPPNSSIRRRLYVKKRNPCQETLAPLLQQNTAGKRVHFWRGISSYAAKNRGILSRHLSEIILLNGPAPPSPKRGVAGVNRTLLRVQRVARV